jgi:hypothetical protein
MKGVYSSETLVTTNQNHGVSYRTRVHSYTETGGNISPETVVLIYTVSYPIAAATDRYRK